VLGGLYGLGSGQAEAGSTVELERWAQPGAGGLQQDASGRIQVLSTTAQSGTVGLRSAAGSPPLTMEDGYWPGARRSPLVAALGTLGLGLLLAGGLGLGSRRRRKGCAAAGTGLAGGLRLGLRQRTRAGAAVAAALAGLLAAAAPPEAQAMPSWLTHQGRVLVDGRGPDGSGFFQFALLDSQGGVLWTNDGMTPQPAAFVELPLVQGHFTAYLGRASEMVPLPAAAFAGQELRLRVWFSQDGITSVQLAPDLELGSVPHAFEALTASDALKLDGKAASDFASASHSHAAEDISSGTLSAARLPDGGVGTAKLADGAVNAAKLAGNAVSSDKILDGTITGADLSGSTDITTSGALTGASIKATTELQIGGVSLTASAAEINTVADGITASAAELNQALDGIGAGVTAANLDLLTGGGNADALHTHVLGTSAGWTHTGTTVSLTTGTDSVGIGTPAPEANLDVAGTIRAQYQLIASRVGTTTADSLLLMINNEQGLMLQRDPVSLGGLPSLIGGSGANTVSSSARGATISGGGPSNPADPANTNNRVTDDYGAVGGGADNRAGNGTGSTTDASFATVGGGRGNRSSAESSTVGGGDANTAGGTQATIGGGRLNTASGSLSTISGGESNSASAGYAAVGGGFTNRATGSLSTVGGGDSNTASGNWSAVAGGQNNTASGSNAAVGGGRGNVATSSFATVTGGESNSASAPHGAVGGGRQNSVLGSYANVGGGHLNQATGTYAAVAGGQSNSATATHATVAGGQSNSATATHATVAGGQSNSAFNTWSTVAGGQSNSATATHATVAGGQSNSASAAYATAAGGQSNSAGAAHATVAGGQSNTANAGHSTIGGGRNNLVTGVYATIAGGGPSDPGNPISTNNRVTDDYGTIGGGADNQAGDAAGSTADRSFATIGGGVGNIASGARSTVPGGANAAASRYGQMAYASGAFAVSGDAQSSLYVLRRATTNASWSDLFLDGAGALLTIPVNRVLAFDVLLVARSESGEAAGYHAQGVIENESGNVRFVGAAPDFVDLGEDTITWGAVLVADNTNDALVIRVIPPLIDPPAIRWVAMVRTAEVGF
jgi:hypothetical protein